MYLSLQNWKKLSKDFFGLENLSKLKPTLYLG